MKLFLSVTLSKKQCYCNQNDEIRNENALIVFGHIVASRLKKMNMTELYSIRRFSERTDF